MSDRVYEILRARAGGKKEGLLFPSKRSKCGHLPNMAKRFRLAREKAGLPEDLVLYCGKHDYPTRVLSNTGNVGGGNENDGAPGCENSDEVPASRA